MSQPTPYARSYDFTDFSTENPTAQQPGVQLDAQFDALALTTNETLRNLALIQRDDGRLVNASVRLATLHSEVIAALTLIGAEIFTWATATAYVQGNIVVDGNAVYLVAISHTSGDLGADAAAEKIIRIFDTSVAPLDIRDFEGADPTGSVLTVDANTAAGQRAVAEMLAAGRPLYVPAGDWRFNLPLLDLAAPTDNICIFGDGPLRTRIWNDTLADSLLPIGNSRFATLSGFAVFGNEETGASGNGHAIDMTNPGTIGGGPFYPSFTLLSRLYVSGHRGNGTAKGGGTMPACAVYPAGSLGTVVDQCWFGGNGFAVYAWKAAQLHIGQNTTLDGNLFGGIVFDQCENPRLLDPDIVGGNTGSTGGTIRVGNAGVQSGGTVVQAGDVIDWFSVGAEYRGGKVKDHIHKGFSMYAPDCPLIHDVWIRQETDGAIGIFNARGVRAIANKFTFAGGEFVGTRTCIKTLLSDGYSHIGEISSNRFNFGGSGAFGIMIDIDGSSLSGVSMTGIIGGNSAGSPVPLSSSIDPTSTLEAFIKVTGSVRNVAVAHNHVEVPTHLTVAVAYNFAGVTQTQEGLSEGPNSGLANGGTITLLKSFAASADYTGLQLNGGYNVKSLTVRGVQVIGGRETGWTAGTGTALKGPIATFAKAYTPAYTTTYNSAYSAPTVSNPPTQAEVQGIADALALASTALVATQAALATASTALVATEAAVQDESQRRKALEDMNRTHGLIN